MNESLEPEQTDPFDPFNLSSAVKAMLGTKSTTMPTTPATPITPATPQAQPQSWMDMLLGNMNNPLFTGLMGALAARSMTPKNFPAFGPMVMGGTQAMQSQEKQRQAEEKLKIEREDIGLRRQDITLRRDMDKAKLAQDAQIHGVMTPDQNKTLYQKIAQSTNPVVKKVLEQFDVDNLPATFQKDYRTAYEHAINDEQKEMRLNELIRHEKDMDAEKKRTNDALTDAKNTGNQLAVMKLQLELERKKSEHEKVLAAIEKAKGEIEQKGTGRFDKFYLEWQKTNKDKPQVLAQGPPLAESDMWALGSGLSINPLTRRPPTKETQAMQQMRDSYMKAGPNQTAKGFQEYLASDAGKKNLQAYEASFRETPTAPKPAPGPLGGGTERIRVKEKATGRAGTIPENEFDPAKYDRIQ